MKMNEMTSSLKAYTQFRQNCEAEFQSAKQYLDTSYNQNTTAYQQLLDKIGQERDAKINSAKEKTLAKVEKAFSDANQKLDDHVVAPMSPELNSILGVLNTLKDTVISDAEAELYYRQMKGNYTAMRLGLPMLIKATGKEYPFMGYDDVKDTIDRMESKVSNWVINYNPTSYDHFDFMTTFEQDLKNCDEQVENFIGGNI